MKNDEQLLPKKAEKALLNQIAQLASELRSHADTSAKSFVAGVNVARQIGLLFQELTGHEQLTLFDFQKFSGRLPDSLDFAFCKKCVWVSHAAKAPVQSFSEARFCEQQLFQACGFLEETRRTAPHSAKVDEPFARWAINRLSSWTAVFEEKMKEQPIEDLAPITLESLRERLKPWAHLYAKISHILGLH